jgi:hypothetical protein
LATAPELKPHELSIWPAISSVPKRSFPNAVHLLFVARRRRTRGRRSRSLSILVPRTTHCMGLRSVGSFRVLYRTMSSGGIGRRSGTHHPPDPSALARGKAREETAYQSDRVSREDRRACTISLSFNPRARHVPSIISLDDHATTRASSFWKKCFPQVFQQHRTLPSVLRAFPRFEPSSAEGWLVSLRRRFPSLVLRNLMSIFCIVPR